MEIGAAREGPFVPVEAVVDPGAFYSWVPAGILRELGVQPTTTREFQLADGSVIQRELGEAVVRIDGQMAHTFFIFGDEGTEPLLGAYTLEAFALVPDPVNQRLLPIPRLYLLRKGTP